MTKGDDCWPVYVQSGTCRVCSTEVDLESVVSKVFVVFLLLPVQLSGIQGRPCCLQRSRWCPLTVQECGSLVFPHHWPPGLQVSISPVRSTMLIPRQPPCATENIFSHLLSTTSRICDLVEVSVWGIAIVQSSEKKGQPLVAKIWTGRTGVCVSSTNQLFSLSAYYLFAVSLVPVSAWPLVEPCPRLLLPPQLRPPRPRHPQLPLLLLQRWVEFRLM